MNMPCFWLKLKSGKVAMTPINAHCMNSTCCCPNGENMELTDFRYAGDALGVQGKIWNHFSQKFSEGQNVDVISGETWNGLARLLANEDLHDVMRRQQIWDFIFVTTIILPSVPLSEKKVICPDIATLSRWHRDFKVVFSVQCFVNCF